MDYNIFAIKKFYILFLHVTALTDKQEKEIVQRLK